MPRAPTRSSQQTILGHSQLSTTRRDTHVPIEITKAAIGRLEIAFSKKDEKPEAPAQPSAPVTDCVTVNSRRLHWGYPPQGEQPFYFHEFAG